MSIIKAILNALMGDDEYENGNDSLSKPKREHKHSDMEDFESIEDTNEDNFEDKDDNEFEDEDEDDDSGLSEEEVMVLESALRSFYSRLSEKELEDPDIDKIVNEVSTLLEDAAAYEAMSKAVNPYGDGQACRRIADTLAGKDTDRYEVK